MEFTSEELFEAIDRLVAGLLERAGLREPPVDALFVATEHLGLPVHEQAPSAGRGGRVYRHRTAGAVVSLVPGMTYEQRHQAAAEGIVAALLPELCRKLHLPWPAEQRGLLTQFRPAFVPRLLLPTRWFRAALRECKHDLYALKERFRTASYEMIALRWLDSDTPCIVSIVDDGVPALRRSNTATVGKKLEPAEQICHDRIAQLQQPQRHRSGGWTVYGWPIPDRLTQRIILYAVPDDV